MSPEENATVTGRDLMILLFDTRVSQTELGKRLGVSKQVVNAWIRGTRPIPRKYVPRIPQVLGLEAATSAEAMIGGQSPP